MDVNLNYIVGDILQTGVLNLILAYFLAPRFFPVQEDQAKLLELSEEMLLHIASVFGTGIALGIVFLMVYFLLYLLRDCRKFEED